MLPGFHKRQPRVRNAAKLLSGSQTVRRNNLTAALAGRLKLVGCLPAYRIRTSVAEVFRWRSAEAKQIDRSQTVTNMTMTQASRRHVVAGLASTAAIASMCRLSLSQALAAGAPQLEPALPVGLGGVATLEALKGKVPLLKLSYRPPNYETPIGYFRNAFTPNEAFFVRYHLANIPEVDAKSWRLRIGGDAATTPYVLSLEELKAFEPVEIAAVCQCSGNRRGLFKPHVPGVQWGYGAMGNAKWKGARLKDILTKAGIKDTAREIVLDGADGPVLDKTPDFVKSLPAAKAMEDSVLVAYEMNGTPLPHWNGFPARIVVPGWTATYWMKHVTSIQAVSQPFDGFWMKTAYRIPVGAFPVVSRFLSQENAVTTPITEMMVNSLIVSPSAGQSFKQVGEIEVSGIAWDGGYGISSVVVSIDGDSIFTEATFGTDSGRFSFRPWSYRFRPARAGAVTIVASARNRIGQTQTTEPIPNPAGYHQNVMHRVTVQIG
jgi:DMSO/TMAO reductase YedYZ molybdopterin-dependent catalytic subunit